MIFTPYLFALHAAILMYILQKINSIRSLSVFVQRSLLLMSNLIVISVTPNQHPTRILLLVLTKQPQTYRTSFVYFTKFGTKKNINNR